VRAEFEEKRLFTRKLFSKERVVNSNDINDITIKTIK